MTTYFNVEIIVKPHREKRRCVKRNVPIGTREEADTLVAWARERGLFATALQMPMPRMRDVEEAKHEIEELAK